MVIVGSIMVVELGLRGGFGTILPFEYWYSSSGSLMNAAFEVNVFLG